MKRQLSIFLALLLLLAMAPLARAAEISHEYRLQLQGEEADLYDCILQNLMARHETFTFTPDEPMQFETDKVRDAVHDMVMRAYEAFYRDHPEVFWVTKEGGIKIEPETEKLGGMRTAVSGITITTVFNDPANIEAKQKALSRAAAAVAASAGGSDYERLKAIHDALTSTCVYDTNAKNNPPAFPDAFESYGALVNGRAVCEGYAKAFSLLCNRMGIPCVLVGGTVRGEDHMWNYVRVDGAYYLVDITFDDPVDAEPSDKYFLKGSASTADHVAQGGFIVDFDAGFENPPLSESDYVPGKSAPAQRTETGYCTVSYAAAEGGRCAVTFTGLGEPVDNGQQVPQGMVLTVQALPAPGYRVKEIAVQMDGAQQTESGKERLFVTVTGNCAITAVFEAQ